MATIKVKFRKATADNHEGSIYYQIIHKRKPRQLPSDLHVLSSEWDDIHSTVIIPNESERRAFLLSIMRHIGSDVERLTGIIRKMNNDRLDYTADDVINEFNRYVTEYSLFSFMESIIMRLKHQGKIRTAETYTATLNNFKRFVCETMDHNLPFREGGLMLDCLNADVMRAYEAWQKKRGVAPNTISFYNRILRAVYNRAVERGIIENRNPFRHVYTGIDKTAKRAIPLHMIKQIRYLDLSLNPTLDYARDIFLLSFMLRGMSFIDMAFLRKSDLKNNYITYRRRKTGQRMTIQWTKEMQLVINKYPENESEYLLPIIKNPGSNERSTYRNACYNINHNLKVLSKLLGLPIPLTLYVARHSWASAAKAKGIPVSVISEGMGHDNENTTRIYLASLDTDVVDKANSLIIKSLR
ncbi:MAG: site-specific integrase [Odoribacter sp.]|nr:site-specific integrase [Odoribacter sp.]